MSVCLSLVLSRVISGVNILCSTFFVACVEYTNRNHFHAGYRSDGTQHSVGEYDFLMDWMCGECVDCDCECTTIWTGRARWYLVASAIRKRSNVKNI